LPPQSNGCAGARPGDASGFAAAEHGEDDDGSSRSRARSGKQAAPAAVPVSVGDGMPFSIKLAEDVPVDAEEGRILHFTVVDGLKVGDKW